MLEGSDERVKDQRNISYVNKLTHVNVEITRIPYSEMSHTYPLRRATLTNPFLSFSVNLKLSGLASKDSAAPPITMAAE